VLTFEAQGSLQTSSRAERLQTQVSWGEGPFWICRFAFRHRGFTSSLHRSHVGHLEVIESELNVQRKRNKARFVDVSSKEGQIDRCSQGAKVEIGGRRHSRRAV
jgi:hypothetical protein